MQTSDFIQLLELAPEMPVKVEYLPGLFLQDNLSIGKIEKTKEGSSSKFYLQIHIQEKNNAPGDLKTTDLCKAIQGYIGIKSDVSESEVKIVYGNKNFLETELDINEVEVFQRSFTLKLFSTNNLKKAKERAQPNSAEKPVGKRKKRFSALLKNLSIPIGLRLSFNIPWLQISKIK